MPSEDAIIKRILPNSLEAEKSVIGSMIMDQDAIVAACETITKDDFYHKQFGGMFEAMVELYNEGKPVDVVTLQERLKEKSLPEEVRSTEFIAGLVADVPTSANIRHYARIVADKAALRRLIRVAENIEKECYEDSEPLDDIMDHTEHEVFRVLQNRGNDDYVPIKQIVINVLEKIEQASKTRGNVTGLASGFTDLDYKTAGFQPSDLILLAARPSMGKTAFALNIAQHVVTKRKEAVAIFSLEMSKEQLTNRLLSMESHVDSQSIRSGNLRDEEWECLIESAGVLGKSGLIIDDTPSISTAALRSKARKYKLEYDIKLILIDYLQLMTAGGTRTESRQQEISDISRALKAIARELNVPIIALSQLSRAVEKRDDKRPMLSDLRESGAIEQDADVVMFLYRDEYYNKDSEAKNIAEVIIAKQRNGPTGTVNLMWLPQYTQFRNLERRQTNE